MGSLSGQHVRSAEGETLTPHEFDQKYGFKNDPAEVRLIDH